MVQKVLQAATGENDNPDIRDRAYVYWRLLSNTTEPNAAKNVVLSQKPPITTTIQTLPPALLEQLLEEMSTLASVYHKPPEQFVGQGRFGADAVQRAAIEYELFFPLLPTHLRDAKMVTDTFPIGNNFKTRARTHWQQQPPPPPSQVLLPRLKLSRTRRICWISISMELHLLRPTSSLQLACQVWKGLQGHPYEHNHQQYLRLSKAIT